MKIRLSISVSKDNSLLENVYRDVDWPAIPRNGDSVDLFPDNLPYSASSYVRTVHFEFDGSIHVRLSNLLDISPGELTMYGWQK